MELIAQPSCTYWCRSYWCIGNRTLNFLRLIVEHTIDIRWAKDLYLYGVPIQALLSCRGHKGLQGPSPWNFSVILSTSPSQQYIIKTEHCVVPWFARYPAMTCSPWLVSFQLQDNFYSHQALTTAFSEILRSYNYDTLLFDYTACIDRSVCCIGTLCSDAWSIRWNRFKSYPVWHETLSYIHFCIDCSRLIRVMR